MALSDIKSEFKSTMMGGFQSRVMYMYIIYISSGMEFFFEYLDKDLKILENVNTKDISQFEQRDFKERMKMDLYELIVSNQETSPQ